MSPSDFSLLTLTSLFSTLTVCQWYVVVFLFWRLAYNLGLGIILYQQSNNNAFSNYWKGHPASDKIKQILKSMMEDDYDFDVSRATHTHTFCTPKKNLHL